MESHQYGPIESVGMGRTLFSVGFCMANLRHGLLGVMEKDIMYSKPQGLRDLGKVGRHSQREPLARSSLEYLDITDR